MPHSPPLGLSSVSFLTTYALGMETRKDSCDGRRGGSSKLAGRALKAYREWVGLKEKGEKPWFCSSVLPARNDHTVHANSQARVV